MASTGIHHLRMANTKDINTIQYAENKTHLARLVSILCQALRICTGTMGGTWLAVIQAHCGGSKRCNFHSVGIKRRLW